MRSAAAHQYITPLVLRVPFLAVLLQALVYGLLTASGTAGGRAGEYAGNLFLRGDAVSQSNVVNATAYPLESFAAVDGSRQRVKVAEASRSRVEIHILAVPRRVLTMGD